VNDKLAYTFSDADSDQLLKLAVYKGMENGACLKVM
jgi:hypothetical protein